jgi:hypothetical protein
VNLTLTMEQTVMSVTVVQKMRLGAAIFGGFAMIAVGGAAVYTMQGGDFTASGGSGNAPVTTTTPPSSPAVAKAAPSITGPAPLYAGETPGRSG